MSNFVRRANNTANPPAYNTFADIPAGTYIGQEAVELTPAPPKLCIWNGTKWLVDTSLVVSNMAGDANANITADKGPNSVLGSAVTLSQVQADATHNGFISSADWVSFNTKQAALVKADATHNGYLASADYVTFAAKQNALSNASSSVSGILTNTDWSVFNAKQAPLSAASASVSGYLTSSDWSIFSGKQSVLTQANLNGDASSNISVAGSGKVINSGLTITQSAANGSAGGYLTGGDWSLFNAKQAALTFGTVTALAAAGLSLTGTPASAVVGAGFGISQAKATASQNGYLASADFVTFSTAPSKTPPNFLSLTGSGTYTVPAGALYLHIFAQGGGGGGAGAGIGGGNGGNGSNTTFGSTLVVASGGSGTTFSTGNGGTGGSGSFSGAGVSGIIRNGQSGQGRPGIGLLSISFPGTSGGSSFAGPGGQSTAATGTPEDGINGGGGQGGAALTSAIIAPAAGGGGGGNVTAWVSGTLSSTYAYSVASSQASGGAAGLTGTVGAKGGAGSLTVVAYYS